MIRFLPYLISLLLLFPLSLHGEQPTRYYMELKRDDSNISGLLILKQEDGKILGSIINEFGVSAIDFSYDINRRKMRLINVIKFLDKWYIKRTLSRDIAFCISELMQLNPNLSNKYIIISNPDSTQIVNRRQNISYSFTPVNCHSTDAE